MKIFVEQQIIFKAGGSLLPKTDRCPCALLLKIRVKRSDSSSATALIYRYTHINTLFSDTIDWKLIQTHLPDMLRVLLSIKDSRITASTLLRKPGTYSKKNRLYQTFRELECVIRAEFLLKYISNAELRVLIQAATNKSEAFNGFSQWIAFGEDRTVATSNRDEQRKIIKLFSISRVLQGLQRKNYLLEAWQIALLSPYLTRHINRFGQYDLDMGKQPPELLYDLWT